MLKKTKSRNKKVLMGIILGFFVLAGFVTYVHIKHQNYMNHPDSPQAMQYNEKHHTVTKYLSKFAKKQKLNVIFYDPDKPLDFNVLSAKLKSGEYTRITLLAYSDMCPRCNKEKAELAMYIKELATSKAPVIAINKARDAHNLTKHFALPNYYHYPTLFIFDQSDNINRAQTEQLVLSDSKTLMRN